MPWTTNDRVMKVRRTHAAADVVVSTLDGWRRHISGRNASAIAFFGFLSIFPLMLAATTILGFLLEDNEDLQQRIIDGALSDIPVLGQTLADDPASLSGNLWALVIGLGGALWSSTKAFVAIQGSLDDVWEVDVDHRDPMHKQRAKALLGILILGAAQFGSIVITSLVQVADLAVGSRVLLVLAAVAINVAVLAAMYRYMTSASPAWSDLWPGAVVAGTIYTGLQHFGALIVREIADNAGPTYGQFALVLGLVTWLSLLSISALMSAEFNAALVRRREGSLQRVQRAAPVAPRQDVRTA